MPRQEEINKQFILDHFEAFVNNKEASAADRNFAEDFLDHDEPGGPLVGPGPARKMMEAMCKRFPDLHVRVEDILAERDKVVVRNVWTGTAPDGQKIRFKGFVLWRLHDGKIVERWATLGPILQDPTAAGGWD